MKLLPSSIIAIFVLTWWLGTRNFVRTQELRAFELGWTANREEKSSHAGLAPREAKRDLIGSLSCYVCKNHCRRGLGKKQASCVKCATVYEQGTRNAVKERMCVKPLGTSHATPMTKALYTTEGGCHTQAYKRRKPTVTCVCSTNLCNVQSSPVVASRLNPFAMNMPLSVNRPNRRRVRPVYGVSGYAPPPMRTQIAKPQRSLKNGSDTGVRMQKMTFGLTATCLLVFCLLLMLKRR